MTNKPEPAQELLDTNEAAIRCRVEPATIRKWVREGRLPARRTPGPNGRGRFRIDARDLALAFDAVDHERGSAA